MAATAKKAQKTPISGRVVDASSRFKTKQTEEVQDPGEIIDASNRFTPDPAKVVNIPPRRIIRREPGAPHYAQGRVTAAGVMAETNIALKKLEQHSQKFQPTLTQAISEKVARILPSLGVKNAQPELVASIANDAANLTLENLSMIQSKDQIGQVIADSIAQSIHTTDVIPANISESGTYNKVYNLSADIVQKYQTDLEKAAVLGNIAAITSLPGTSDIAGSVIEDQVEQQADIDAPLSTIKERASAKNQVHSYLQNYTSAFTNATQNSVASNNVITLEQLQKIKEDIHNQAIKGQSTQDTGKINIKETTANAATLLSLKPLTVEKANILGLGTAQPNTIALVKAGGISGFGVGLAMGVTPQIQKETIYSLLAYNNPKLDTTIHGLQERQRKVEEKIKSLNTRLSSASEQEVQKIKSELFHNKLERKNNRDRLKLYVDAKTFANQRPGQSKALLQYWYKGSKIRLASNIAWGSVSSLTSMPAIPFKIVGGLGSEIKAFASKDNLKRIATPKGAYRLFKSQVGVNFGMTSYMLHHPKSLIKDMVMMNPAFGSLAFGFGMARNIFSLNDTLRMAFSPVGLAKGMGQRMSYGFMKRMIKVSGALTGGLGLLFLGLGQAAFTGFLAGGLAGGLAGAVFGGYLGLQIGIALAPWTFGLSLIVAPILGAAAGFLIGASIGGLAGGLIGYGLGSGTTTAVTTGAGVGVGGIIGAVVGASVGAAVGTFICFGLVICGVFGAYVGAALGAYVGAIAGGAIGYGIGKLSGAFGLPATLGLSGGIVGFFFGGPIGALMLAGTGWLLSGGWKTISNFFGGAGATTGGILSGLGSTLTGWLAAGWNTALGGLGGFFSGASSIIGGLPSFISGAAASAAGSIGIGAVGTSFSAVAGLTVFGLITTAVALSTTESEVQNHTAGDNQYFTINKTADKTALQNPPPDQDVTFTITITAKDIKLANVGVTDEMTYQNKDTTTPITQDKNGQPISPITSCQNDLEPGKNCTATITINVTDAFKDSVIINTVKVTATPDGKEPVSDTKTAIVTVGNPPASCPHGWPTTGSITQGPDGATSHGGPFDPVNGHLDLEAIDIGTLKGTQVYSTIDAIVTGTPPGSGPDDQIIDAEPICAGLVTIRYQHLSKVDVKPGDKITFGQPIGKTGVAGTGPHMHYQFNRTSQRNFKLETPNIPQNFPRACDSVGECATTISSAPL